MRLTISRARRCASERICAPNGKATPHRFAPPRAQAGDTTVPPLCLYHSGALGGGRYGGQLERASERTLRNLALLFPPDDRGIPFCFSLPPRPPHPRACHLDRDEDVSATRSAFSSRRARSPRCGCTDRRDGSNAVKRNRDRAWMCTVIVYIQGEH